MQKRFRFYFMQDFRLKKKKGETTLNGMPLITNTCLIGWKTFINI